MTLIRTATPADASAIARVQVETWRSSYRGIVSDEFLNAFSQRDRTSRWSDVLHQSEQITFVVKIAGQVVGFAKGGPGRDQRTDFQSELYALYVLPRWHRKGIGRKLVANIARWLLDSGFNSMLVWTLADNPHRGFYESLGGRLVGEKEIEIGQQKLLEVAYGWDDLEPLLGEESREGERR